MHEVDAYKDRFEVDTTLRNKGYCKSWNAQIDKSLLKICHYQHNVPQHYYRLDTLVLTIAAKKRAISFPEPTCLVLVLTKRHVGSGNEIRKREGQRKSLSLDDEVNVCKTRRVESKNFIAFRESEANSTMLVFGYFYSNGSYEKS